MRRRSSTASARGSTGTVPNAINDRRQVVGVSAGPDWHYRAFLWENGAMRDLGLPPAGDAAEA